MYPDVPTPNEMAENVIELVLPSSRNDLPNTDYLHAAAEVAEHTIRQNPVIIQTVQRK